MRGNIPPYPQYIFMAWCFAKRRDKFTFRYIRKSSRVTVGFSRRTLLYELFS